MKELGIGEATVCGCINTGANAIGFILVLALTKCLGSKEINIACGVLAGIIILSGISMFLVR